MISRIISGGQTGADRAALDWAIDNGIPHGGWCPKGRLALDGPLDSKYALNETPSKIYPQRTEWNARDSDGTVIFTISAALTGGSKKTAVFADKHGRPWVHVSREADAEPASKLSAFVEEHGIKALNVAGPRATKEPEVYAFVQEVLEEAFQSA